MKKFCIWLFFNFVASASFAIQIDVIERSGDGAAQKIKISGEIQQGDNEKLVNFIRTNPMDALTGKIYLSSNGGDVREAMKLAQTLKRIYKIIIVDDVCASSCLLLYLSGGMRIVNKGRLGVHRPYFKNAYFDQLPLVKAEVEYKKMERDFYDFVTSQGLPRSIYEKLLATPSTEVYWLTSNDLALIGMSPPYLEEKIIAACGAVPKNLTDMDAYIKCQRGVIFPHSIDGVAGMPNNK
jgi:hypothetical protein